MGRWRWLLVVVVAGLVGVVVWGLRTPIAVRDLSPMTRPVEEVRYSLVDVGRYSLVNVGLSRPVVTRPVEIRNVSEIWRGEPETGHTVTVLGSVIDSATREGIAGAHVDVFGDGWFLMFAGSEFGLSFPTMQPVTITTWAHGYETRQDVMKAHYQRNVTLTMEIPLQEVE